MISGFFFKKHPRGENRMNSLNIVPRLFSKLESNPHWYKLSPLNGCRIYFDFSTSACLYSGKLIFLKHKYVGCIYE
jgi:hypothetical protein